MTHADRTGKQVMYAFNVTGELDEMKRRHDAVLAAGGTCVMVSLNSRRPRRFHRACGGMRRCRSTPTATAGARMTRHPLLGFDYLAWAKLWRLAGADHMHVNGLRNKFYESDASVIASARACLTPMFDRPLPACVVMPVFSSGQSAVQVPETFAALNSTDLILTCGGGIMGHPGGVAAGVVSLRQAWDAAMAGEDLKAAATRAPELRQALETFG